MTLFSVRRSLIAVFCCCASLQPASVTAQLDDLLSSLLSGGKEGKIRSVAVDHDEGDRVVLLVRYSDVRNPQNLRITARVLETKLKALDGFEISTEELTGTEGSVEVTVGYTGTRDVTSGLVEARLVRTDGRAVAVQVAPVVRRWSGQGSTGGGAESPRTEPAAGGADATAPSTSDTSESGMAGSGGASREFLIRPTPLPGTPVAGAATPPAPTPPPSVPPSSPTPPLEGGRGRRAGADVGVGKVGTIGTIGTMILAAPALLQVAPKSDLYLLAQGAEWSNGSDRLPFNGANSDARGFVRALGRARLGDGRDYDSVLQTHPQWTNNGRIEGSFGLSLPGDAQTLSFGLGFLAGAGGSDGVRFQVACEAAGRTTVWFDESVAPASVVQRQVTVPAELRGQHVRLRLITLAGSSSGQDWAVWIAPRVN